MLCFMMNVNEAAAPSRQAGTRSSQLRTRFFLQPFYCFIKVADIRIKCSGYGKVRFLAERFPDKEMPSLNCLISLIKSKDVKS